MELGGKNKMTLFFTKIRWAGEDCILITNDINPREPIVILTGYDLRKLKKEWGDEK